MIYIHMNIYLLCVNDKRDRLLRIQRWPAQWQLVSQQPGCPVRCQVLA